jgi:hypothetical protein
MIGSSVVVDCGFGVYQTLMVQDSDSPQKNFVNSPPNSKVGVVTVMRYVPQ